MGSLVPHIPSVVRRCMPEVVAWVMNSTDGCVYFRHVGVTDMSVAPNIFILKHYRFTLLPGREKSKQIISTTMSY